MWHLSYGGQKGGSWGVSELSFLLHKKPLTMFWPKEKVKLAEHLPVVIPDSVNLMSTSGVSSKLGQLKPYLE